MNKQLSKVEEATLDLICMQFSLGMEMDHSDVTVFTYMEHLVGKEYMKENVSLYDDMREYHDIFWEQQKIKEKILSDTAEAEALDDKIRAFVDSGEMKAYIEQETE